MALRYSANLSMLYNEVSFLDRFAQAAAAGFAAVEFLFPYEAGVEAIRTRLGGLGLRLALFNLHAGDSAAGEWGTLSNPRRRDYFRWSFDTALEAARRLDCGRLNMMIGQRVAAIEPEAQIACAVENLSWAAPQAAEAGVTLLIEPLNPTDFPNYLVQDTATALNVVTQAGQPQVKLLYDVYHAQIAEGNLIDTITACFPHIGHMQIADVPGRHQPGTGEINYPAIFAAVARLGYQGYIGLEYRPRGETDASLDWLPREERGQR